MTTTVDQDLERVVRVVRKHVLTVCSPDSCIASTAVLIEVLRYLGLDARPQAAHVKVFSPLAVDLLTRRVPMSQWPAEARYVWLGDTGESRPGRWDGHLMAILERGGQTILLDPSIDQAARPERDIRVGPLVADITSTGGLPTAITLPTGTTLYYAPLDDTRYRSSSNWRPTRMRRPIAEAIRELRKV